MKRSLLLAILAALLVSFVVIPAFAGQNGAIIIDPNHITIYEQGQIQNSFTIVLGWQPQDPCDVIVMVECIDLDNDGCLDDFLIVASTEPDGSKHLTFNSSNYNIPQAVFVQPIDDPESECEESYQLFISTTTTGDPDFDGVVLHTLITIVDNDGPCIPTLSQWAIVAMTIILLSTGALVIKRTKNPGKTACG